MKTYYVMSNIGRSRYVVNYHDGEKVHKDGSRFFDVSTYSNKRDCDRFVAWLKKEGYSLSR